MASWPSGSPPKPQKKSSTHDTICSASDPGSPIIVRKTSVGYRSANALTKSHSPCGAISATSRRQIFRAVGSTLFTAPGANHGLRIWRYLTCSGGSICVGTNRYTARAPTA